MNHIYKGDVFIMTKVFTVIYKGNTFKVGVVEKNDTLPNEYNGCIVVNRLGEDEFHANLDKTESRKFLKNPKRYIRLKMKSWFNFIITGNKNQTNIFDYMLPKVILLER